MAISAEEDDGIDWDALRASLNDHANIIGRVTVNWNMCQLIVFTLFAGMSAMSWEQARAVFFALKADVHQREITMALANELKGKRSPKKKIIAAVARLNELANERNAATHTMWQVNPELGRLAPAPEVAHNPKLDLGDPLKQFQVLDEKLSLAHSALMKALIALGAYRASLRKSFGLPPDPVASELAAFRLTDSKTPRPRRRSLQGSDE